MPRQQVVQIVNVCIILLLLLVGYQNCAGRMDTSETKHVLDQSAENWELLVTSESGDVVFENSAAYLTVSANKALGEATCEWTHERNDQTTTFENKECSLKLDAVTPDDNGLYSVKVVSKDGDSILLGPVLLNVSPGDGVFPEISNVLKSYVLVSKEVASILVSPNTELAKGEDCAIEWTQLETGKKVGCGQMLNFDKVQDYQFGEYSVAFTLGDKRHVQYFSVDNKNDRTPATKPLSCGHSAGRIANLISELRSTVPEMYVGEFGDSRWTLAQFSRETADRLCVLSDTNFISADSVKIEKLDLPKSGLPGLNVRAFDPPTRKWASVCQNGPVVATGKKVEKACSSEWIIHSLTCCKNQ